MSAILITWIVILVLSYLSHRVGYQYGFKVGHAEGKLDHWERGYRDGQMDAIGNDTRGEIAREQAETIDALLYGVAVTSKRIALDEVYK